MTKDMNIMKHSFSGKRKNLANRRMRLCCLPAVVPALFFLLMPHALVYGQQAHAHSAEPVVLETISVTAERIEAYVENYPNQVSVMGQKEILSRNMLSVEEALNAMDGVDVKKGSGIGSRISIRGSGNSGGVLVLLNGRPLNTNQYGGVDLSAIPIDMVQSITVFKPPVPVWLGPGASDGAVSITTRDRGEKEKNRSSKIRLAGGSYGVVEGSVSHQLKYDSDMFMASAGGSHADGKRANSDRNTGSASLHWDRERSEAQRIVLDGRFYASKHGSAGPLDNPTPDARQTYRQASLDGRMSGFLEDNGEYALNLYGDTIDLKDESQSGFTSTLDDMKWGIKGERCWNDENDLWSVRLNGIFETDEVDHTLSGFHRRVAAGLGAQADRRWNALSATVGMRGDQTSDFDFSPGFSGGLSYGLAAHWLARINAGYSVKTPTFGQLYQPSHGSIDQVRGNPDLDEERIWSCDAGIEYRKDKDHLVQVSFFRSDIRDPIVYQRGADRVYQPVNADRSWRHGMEATFKRLLENGLTVDLNAIVQDSEVCETGKELPYTPAVKLKLSLLYTLKNSAVRLETTARYVSDQYSESENRKDQRIDAYATMDLKAVKPFKIKVLAAEWFVHIENLFDADFEAHYGYPDDGIRFVSGLNLTF